MTRKLLWSIPHGINHRMEEPSEAKLIRQHRLCLSHEKATKMGRFSSEKECLFNGKVIAWNQVDFLLVDITWGLKNSIFLPHDIQIAFSPLFAYLRDKFPWLKICLAWWIGVISSQQHSLHTTRESDWLGINWLGKVISSYLCYLLCLQTNKNCWSVEKKKNVFDWLSFRSSCAS